MAFNPGQNNNAMGAGQFDNLISQLRAQQQNSATSTNQAAMLPPQLNNNNNPQYYHQQASHQYPQQASSLSSPHQTTPNQRPQQQRQSSLTMSPTSEAYHSPTLPQSNQDRTASLLNLLKFSGPGSNPAAPNPLPQATNFGVVSHQASAAAHQASTDGRNTPTSDLMAALMGTSYSKQPSTTQSQNNSRVSSASFRPQSSAPPQDTQNFLLQLLNRPKPAQTSDAAPEPQQATASIPEVTELPRAIMQGQKENAPHDAGKKPSPVIFGGASSSSRNLFTYENPFEELARSSPRNPSSKQATPAGSSTPVPAVQILKHPRNNIATELRGGGSSASNTVEITREHEIAEPPPYLEAQHATSPVPVLPDGRTEIEALMGIGAPNKGKETVSEALNVVAKQASQEANAALLEVEKHEAEDAIEKDMQEMMHAKTDQEFEQSAQHAAQTVMKELEKSGNEHVLEDNLPAPVAEAVKEILEGATQGNVVDSWESADAEETPSKDTPSYVVKVYNFPMRPFAALTVDIPAEERTAIRSESTLNIARMKKEFDQIDRTLCTATDTFIIYCTPAKSGGVRVIHQGDGNNFVLWKNLDDRMFNITASTSSETEAIVGTGVANNIYWAVISRGEYDGQDVHETKSFILPPPQTHDGESPGVLKTRARKSGSHPEFFAVGRGKSIHIIQPDIILKDKSYFANIENRIVDTEKYVNDHAMIINTGKAGKDFTFSPDDSVIVSLDKAGKVKVWDVRPFTGKWVSSEIPVKAVATGEIKEPMMTFITTPPGEKSWATSVLFVDKPKPYQRGGPLRYLIIGMKQNHTLQLWDLALGKAVQELNLPHENESDAVCSVLYHPPTNIIIVGHPTRNSIYFIHLSSPRYNLSRGQNQAEYIEKLVARDPAVRPDSTAVMSGVREFSFATPEKGVLRSLDILQQPTSSNPSSEPVLFELYAMHSKGITCISIKQDDLGWSPDNRVLHPVDAEKASVVKVEGLQSIVSSPESVGDANGFSPAPSARSVTQRQAPKDATAKDTGKKVAGGKERSQSSDTAMRTASPVMKAGEKIGPKANGSTQESNSGAEKPSRSRKKKDKANSASSEASRSQAGKLPSIMEHPTILTRNGSPSKSQKAPEPDNSLAVASSSVARANTPSQAAPSLDKQAIDNMVKSIEGSIAPEVTRALNSSFQGLYKRLDEDRRIQETAHDVKEETLLRLVDKALGENLNKSIEHSVRQSVEKQVLPALIGLTSNALNEQFGSKLTAQMSKLIPRELQNVIPDAVAKTLQKPALVNVISDSVAGAIIPRVESQVLATLEQAIMPVFSNLMAQTAQQIANDAQQQAKAQIKTLVQQHNKDSQQIAQLTQLVTNLSNTVSTMADVQSKFQEEFLKFQRQTSNSGRPTPSNTQSVVRSPTPSNAPAPIAPAVDSLEDTIRGIQESLQSGELEAGVVAWLQSGQEEQIFRQFFSRLNNLEFIEQLNPLVHLTVLCAVTDDLTEFEPLKKLDWVEKILVQFPCQQGYTVPLDERIRQVLPNTMTTVEQRLNVFYNRVRHHASHPVLDRIGSLAAFARQIRMVYGIPTSN